MSDFNVDQPQTRVFESRAAADQDKREISAVGVPLEDEVTIYGHWREVFDQECVFERIESAKLKRDHRTLIGVITEHTREPGKLTIVGRASKTAAADEALELAADGALDSMSIGFRPIEYTRTDHEDGSYTIRHLRVRVTEFSLTDNPAYDNATVTDVRDQTTAERTPIMTTPIAPEATEVAELRTEMNGFAEALRTAQAQLADITTNVTPQTTINTRSAGDVLKLIADGDETMIREYNDMLERAYTGGTTADAPVKDGWVGDLTRIFDASSGVLSEIFSTGVLPETGMNIEYAQLKTNTTKVEKQAAEGDDLATGKVTLENKTAPVETYGGYVELSIQQIKRSTLPILNRSLEAMSMAAGARKKAVLRAAYLALVAERKAIAADAGVLSIGGTLAAATATNWTDLIVDAAMKFDGLSLALEGMIVSPTVFKKLNALEVQGHRVFNVSSERNTIGTLNLPSLQGDIGGITVVADPGRTGEAAEFVNSRALRHYGSPVMQLQDENIINLSSQFSVYNFGATAKEIPEGVVPVKFAA